MIDQESQYLFVGSMEVFMRDASQWAIKQGFMEEPCSPVDAKTVGCKIALIHGELSEAMEGIRVGNPADRHIPEFTSLEAELADAVIRIFGLAVQTGSRLPEAILAKQKYNEGRELRNGKNF